MIATRNRSDDLCRAVASAIEQDGPVEVLVMDDGSTDGTSELVRERFPEARYVGTSDSKGYVAQRNAAADLASAEVLVSIDDDAILSTPNVVTEAVADLQHPRVGAVAVPVEQAAAGGRVDQRAPDEVGIYATDAFVGTAYAVKREVFLELGGFDEAIFHQGEERDFCLRLLNAGYITRLGTGDMVRHCESPRRSVERMDLYGRRNDVLFAWQRVPSRYLVPHLIATTVAGMRLGVQLRRPARMARGLAMGYREILRYRHAREPVRPEVYRLHRHLRKRGPMRLEEALSGLDT